MTELLLLLLLLGKLPEFHVTIGFHVLYMGSSTLHICALPHAVPDTKTYYSILI